MRITLVTVGKIKEKYLKDAIAEYSKRLGKYCKLEIIEVADEKTPENASATVEDMIRQKEGERIDVYKRQDLGAEKFFDIKCRKAGLKPDAVVLVATVRALKYNGGVAKADLSEENLEALKKGIVNLEKHIENIQKYDIPVVVTLNSFVTDTKAENEFIRQFCQEKGCEFALSEVWEKGGEGGIALANKVFCLLYTSTRICLSEDAGSPEKEERDVFRGL